ncbi:hypothetical protein H1D32_14110 [Anaerobacillus sp. CMMVII]|uniref:hypothetical protein n=1 Tax=Anaerobacillus sp. CMMVII TaxID=2755588 RepID=UPI0021B7348E|nr:hypothetical protein [Anaerobacillus sp. CMMVII]MCT8138770.1 hypothetical protein [Anaerobacillus sp. CMMVII]
MKKTTVFSSIIGIVILTLIALILPKYEQTVVFFNIRWVLIYSFLLSVLYLLFGILIETKRLIKVFAERVRVNCLLLSFVVILFLLFFIPAPYWLTLLPNNFFFSFIFRIEIQVILNVLAGILFIRSFDKEN